MDLNEKPSSEQNGETANHNSPPSSLALEAASKHRAKTAKILEACKWKDIGALRCLATSEAGLVSDEIRRQAWPLLLGYEYQDSIDTKREDEDPFSWKMLPKHRDEDQVKLDVDRSFIFYPKDLTSSDLDCRKEELSDLIIEVLRRLPYLSYFQGYHDICQVFLLVLEPSRRAPALARLSALRIRDFMLPTFAQALDQLHLIPAIISRINPALYNKIAGTQPFFALSGTLTMYAHDIQEYGDISRVFDVLLAREAVFSVYMFTQIILQRSDELFEIPDDEPEILHFTLSKLPNPLNIETLIENAVTLFKQHPPESFKMWRSISNSSVLKTARWEDQLVSQSLRDGELYFQKQVKELELAERRKKFWKMAKKYRGPVQTLGVAVLIGLASILLHKSSGRFDTLGSMYRFWREQMGH